MRAVFVVFGKLGKFLAMQRIMQKTKQIKTQTKHLGVSFHMAIQESKRVINCKY